MLSDDSDQNGEHANPTGATGSQVQIPEHNYRFGDIFSTLAW